MKLRRTLSALAVAPMALAGLAATSEPTDCRVFDDSVPVEDQQDICTLETFMQCPGDDTEKAYHEALHTEVELGLGIPERSVQEGAGCGRVPQALFRGTATNTPFDMQIAGFFQENIDEMTVVLHAISAGPERVGDPILLPVRVQVNGAMVVGADDGANEIEVTGTPSSTGASYEFRFTITGIDSIADSVNDDPFNVLRFAISYPQGPTPLFGGGGLYTWVWGTSEVPAGVILNPGGDTERGTVLTAGS